MIFGVPRSGVHMEMIRKDDTLNETTVNQYSMQCIRTYLYMPHVQVLHASKVMYNVHVST